MPIVVCSRTTSYVDNVLELNNVKYHVENKEM